MLTTIAFAGCQESEPSRTIVSMQIDYVDGEGTWIYLYTIPRVKMGNLTIGLNDDHETLTSVFSHQRSISEERMNNIMKYGNFKLVNNSKDEIYDELQYHEEFLM